MIRIAFVIPTLDQSGAERQLTLLAEALPRSEFDVHVIALVRGGHFEERLAAAGVTIHVVGKRFRFDPTTLFRFRKLLRTIQPDVIQSFLFSANTLVRLPWIVPQSTHVVVSERCVDSWKSRWQLWVDRRIARRSDAMTANSQSVRDFYSELGVPNDRLHVIRNGLDGVPDQADREWIRRKLELPGHLRLVGYVGRLAEQKCVLDVLWAFQLLHQVAEDVHLVIIGDGPQREYLEQFGRNMGCDDKITFAGHCSDAYRMMQGLDVFCLASSFEGMSNSLMEAMSVGLPVVVSSIPANQELVEAGVNGLTFPVTRAPELTKCIQRILLDQELAQKLGAAAAATIREEFSADRMVQQHVELYRSLLPGNDAGSALESQD